MSRRSANRKLSRKQGFANWLRRQFESSAESVAAPRRLQFETLDSRLLLSGGTEFQVNTFTTGPQATPKIASDAAGDFVVVWQSNGDQDGDDYGIFAQRYNAAGVAQGSEFQVNTYTTGKQSNPSVAMDSAGDFVIAWQSDDDQDGDSNGIFAQRYSSSGTAQGAEFQVNTFTTNDQITPAVAMDATGDFVITWASYGQANANFYGVYAQRYNASGVKQGSETQVNTFTKGNQQAPAVAMDSVGDFVVTWESYGQDNSSAYGIYAQRFNSAGVKQSTAFQVNTFTTGSQRAPAVAMDAAGDFTIAWQSYGQASGTTYSIYAQRYNSTGVAQGSTFQVSTFTGGNQISASVSMDSTGDFVISWASYGQEGPTDYGVYAQRYTSSGALEGSQLHVNSFTTGNQETPAVAMDSTGDFVAAWESYGQDGDSYGIYAHQYNEHYTVTETGSSGDETLIITKPSDITGTLTMTSDAQGDVTFNDPSNLFAGGPLTGVVIGGNSVIVNHATAGVVHVVLDFTAASGQTNSVTIGNLNGATIPGFDFLAAASDADTVTFASSSVTTGGSIAPNTNINLTDVASVILDQSTTINAGGTNFGTANISAAVTGANLAFNTSATGGVTIGSLTNTAGQFVNNLAINSAVTGGIVLDGNQIETTGSQSYTGDVIVSGLLSAETFISTGGGSITFNTGLDNGGHVLIESDGTTTFAGPVGGSFSPASLTVEGFSNSSTGITKIDAAVTTIGAQTFDNTVLLANNPLLDSTGGSITFNSTVGGASNLTTESPGTTTFNGLVSISSLAATGGLTIIHTGTINTVGPQTYYAPVLLTSNAALVSSQGILSFNSTVGGNASLTTVSSSATTFNALVSIASLFTSGLTKINGVTINTVGAQTYGSAVLLANNPVLISSQGAISFNSTVGGNSNLITSSAGATTFNALISIASLSVNSAGGASLKGGTVMTVGSQTYNAPVVLTGNSVFVSNTGNLTFGGSLSGPGTLSLNSPGTTTFGGSVNLASLSTSSTGMTDINTSSVVTSGDQLYNSLVLLANNPLLTSTQGKITFFSTVGGNSNLSTNSAGPTTFNALVSIASLVASTSGGANIVLSGGTIITQSNQTYVAPVLLTKNTTLTSSANGDFTFAGKVSAAPPGPDTLTLQTLGARRFQGGIGTGVVLTRGF